MIPRFFHDDDQPEIQDDRPSVLCDDCKGAVDEDGYAVDCDTCYGTGLDSVAADRAPLFPMDYRDSYIVLPRGGPN